MRTAKTQHDRPSALGKQGAACDDPSLRRSIERLRCRGSTPRPVGRSRKKPFQRGRCEWRASSSHNLLSLQAGAGPPMGSSTHTYPSAPGDENTHAAEPDLAQPGTMVESRIRQALLLRSRRSGAGLPQDWRGAGPGLARLKSRSLDAQAGSNKPRRMGSTLWPGGVRDTGSRG